MAAGRITRKSNSNSNRSAAVAESVTQQDVKMVNTAQQIDALTPKLSNIKDDNGSLDKYSLRALETFTTTPKKRPQTASSGQKRSAATSKDQTDVRRHATASKRTARLSNSKKELAAIEKIGSRKMEEDDEDFELSIQISFMEVQARERRSSLRQAIRSSMHEQVEETKIIQKAAKRRYSNRYKYILGESPYPEFDGPSPEVCRNVHELLKTHHADEPEASIDTALPPSGPTHASSSITIDSMIQVLISQVARNDFCSLALKNLREGFPFHHDGKTHFGTVPNYHDVLTADADKIATCIAPAGCQQDKSVRIKALLTDVYTKNFESLYPGMECKIVEGEVVGAGIQVGTEFVPGLLSIEYLDDLKKNPQALFDELVKFKGFGVKSAACLMSFHYGLPFFAVDTHVYHITNLLGWFPEQKSPSRDKAAQHMDTKVPDDIKLVLHQEMWHHRQNCRECGGKPEQGQKLRDCPLRSLKDLTRVEDSKNKAEDTRRKSRDETSDMSPRPTKVRSRKRTLSEIGDDQSDRSGLDTWFKGKSAPKKQKQISRVEEIQGKVRCYWQEGDPESVPGYNLIEAPRDNNFGMMNNMRSRRYWQRKIETTAAQTTMSPMARVVAARQGDGLKLIFSGQGVRRLLGGVDALPASSDTSAHLLTVNGETMRTTQADSKTKGVIGIDNNEVMDSAT